MDLLKYISRRIIFLFILTFGITSMVFLLTRLVPGEPELAFLSQRNLSDKEVVIRDRSFSSKKDFGLTISNRAGMLNNAEYTIMPLKEKMQHPCFYPSYTFFMDYNGDVLMCAHDWGKKRILGNLNKKSFLEIWTSQIAKISRKKLNNSDRGFSPCNVCDVHGTLIGEKHSKAWDKIL